MARQKVFGDGRFVFPTRKAAQEQLRSILNSQPLREPLAGADHDLLAAVVAAHPAAAENIGCGIAAIDVRVIDHGTRGFWITRTDGTRTDFSYLKALDGEHTHRSRVNQALRAATRDQVDQFRRDYFAAHTAPVCPLTEQPLRNDKLAEVDHDDPTFAELADRFVAILTDGRGHEHIATRAADNGIGQVLADPHIATVWQYYHRHHARLRVIHRSANSARYQPLVA